MSLEFRGLDVALIFHPNGGQFNNQIASIATSDQLNVSGCPIKIGFCEQPIVVGDVSLS